MVSVWINFVAIILFTFPFGNGRHYRKLQCKYGCYSTQLTCTALEYTSGNGTLILVCWATIMKVCRLVLSLALLLSSATDCTNSSWLFLLRCRLGMVVTVESFNANPYPRYSSVAGTHHEQGISPTQHHPHPLKRYYSDTGLTSNNEGLWACTITNFTSIISYRLYKRLEDVILIRSSWFNLICCKLMIITII